MIRKIKKFFKQPKNHDIKVDQTPFHRAKLRIFLVTYIAYSLLYCARKPLSVVKTQIQQELGVTTTSLANIDTAFLTTYAIGQLLLISLAERIGPRLSLTLVYVLSSFCCALFSQSDTPQQMSLLWLLNGLCHSIAFPLLIRILVPWLISTERSFLLGLWATSQQVGSIIATWFSAIMSVNSGWRVTILSTSCFVLFSGVLLFFFLEDENPLNKKERWEKGEEKKDEEIEGERVSERREELETGFWLSVKKYCWSVYMAPHMKSIAVSYFFFKLIRYALLFWLPFYLATVLDFPVKKSAFLSLFFDIGGILGSIFTGYIANRLFRQRVVLCLSVLSIVTCITLLLFNSLEPYAEEKTDGDLKIIIYIMINGWLISGIDSFLGAVVPQHIHEHITHSLPPSHPHPHAHSHLQHPSLSTNATTTASNGTTYTNNPTNNNNNVSPPHSPINNDNYSMTMLTSFINGIGSLGASCQGFIISIVTVRYGWSVLFNVLSFFSFLSFLLLALVSYRLYFDRSHVPISCVSLSPMMTVVSPTISPSISLGQSNPAWSNTSGNRNNGSYHNKYTIINQNDPQNSPV